MAMTPDESQAIYVMNRAEWPEARMFVFAELQKLREEVKRAQLTADIARDTQDGKQKQDMDIAHKRIRALQSELTKKNIKLWVATSAAGFLSALVVELIKHLFK